MRPAPALLTVVLAIGLTACSGNDSGNLDDDKSPAFDNATETKLDGTFFYVVPETGDDFNRMSVMSFRDGEKPRTLVDADISLYQSAAPSPDGEFLAWVEATDGKNKLRVWDVAKKQLVKAADHRVDPLCKEPAWAGTGHKLLLHPDPMETQANTAQLYDVDKDKLADAKPINGCHPRIPAATKDASNLIFMSGDVKNVVSRDNGKDSKHKTAINDREIVSAPAVAPRNEAFCAATIEPGGPIGDATRHLVCDTIVKTDSGKAVAVKDGFTTALFPATGGILTRGEDGKLRLTEGKNTLDTVAEPKGLAGGYLIGYSA